jgi:hypothetical protein
MFDGLHLSLHVAVNVQLVAAVILIATSKGYSTSAIDVANAAALESGQALPDFVPPTPGFVCNQVRGLHVMHDALLFHCLVPPLQT